jgi:hypothetical protein
LNFCSTCKKNVDSSARGCGRTVIEGLVFAIGESLVVPVVAPVVTLVPVVALVGATLVECSTMRVATLVAAIVASVALVCKRGNLVVIALCHLVAEFAFCAKLDLLLTLFCEGAVGHL